MSKKEENTSLSIDTSTTGLAAPTEDIDWGKYANAGKEDMTSDDYIIPFISLSQATSKIVSGGKCLPGQFYNHAFEEGDDELKGVIVKREWKLVEWKDKKNGGGIVEVYDMDAPSRNPDWVKEGFDWIVPGTDNGNKGKENKVIQTLYLYIQLCDDDYQPSCQVVFPLTSAKIPAWKKWNTKIEMLKQKPPMFANVVSFTSELKPHPEYADYQSLNLTPVNGAAKDSLVGPNHPLFQAGAAFYEMLKAGEARADYAASAGAEHGGADDDDETTPF